MDKLRIRFGLHWPSWHPPVSLMLDWLIGCAAFLLLVLLQGHLDDLDQKASTMSRVAQQARTSADRFRDLFDTCLNGGVVGRSGGTVLACKGAEEIALGKLQLISPVKTQ